MSLVMGNLLRVLNDKGHVPRIDFFVDFESKSDFSRLKTVRAMKSMFVVTS